MHDRCLSLHRFHVDLLVERPELRRQVVGTVTHLSGDERYARLNDVVCVLTGEVQSGEGPDGSTLIVLDVAELVWEPLADAPVRSLR